MKTGDCITVKEIQSLFFEPIGADVEIVRCSEGIEFGLDSVVNLFGSVENAAGRLRKTKVKGCAWGEIFRRIGMI